MAESFQALIDRMFVGPVYPASILLCLLILYSLVAIIGLVDFDIDLPEVDLDTDLDLVQGLGATTLRWTNIAHIPLVLWGGIFTILFWSISYGLWHRFDSFRYEATLGTCILLVIRNLVISVVGTKFLTQPLNKYFAPLPSYNSKNLIGATCEITSLQADANFGTAKFRTDGAPLLLNVRTDGSTLNKGDEARIIDFDPQKRLYKITRLVSETQL
jgi:hypothetical protein